MVSSLVGAIIKHYGLLFYFNYANICIIAGNKKASVLPEPVSAIPIKSCPVKAIDQLYAYIGVGAGNPAYTINSYNGRGKQYTSENLRIGSGIKLWLERIKIRLIYLNLRTSSGFVFGFPLLCRINLHP